MAYFIEVRTDITERRSGIREFGLVLIEEDDNGEKVDESPVVEKGIDMAGVAARFGGTSEEHYRAFIESHREELVRVYEAYRLGKTNNLQGQRL